MQPPYHVTIIIEEIAFGRTQRVESSRVARDRDRVSGVILDAARNVLEQLRAAEKGAKI